MKQVLIISSILAFTLLMETASFAETNWKPADGPLFTQWTEEVSPDEALPEYPRPQLVRKDWLNLNGLWNYAIVAKDTPKPEKMDGQILVPFPVESALSGVMKPVGPENRLWYQRSFTIPQKWSGKRILLHFGAVDWDTTVMVNGKTIGTHQGGYDPFSFDITDALQAVGTQEITVSVWDPTDAAPQPHGKQVLKPQGIFYTAVTGIWQTVWLEPVNPAYINALKIIPDIDAGQVKITADCPGATAGYQIQGVVKTGWFSKVDAKAGSANELIIPMPKAKLWSPDQPNLYDLKVSLLDETGQEVDKVESYFGMRKIAIQKDSDGIMRLFLNDKPLFHHGPLDQGWWPDGLYTAPNDKALKHDIVMTKKLGFNMARKHVKVEPARWYYWCDKLGLLVWQDMPSGYNNTDEGKKNFESELKRMIDNFHNYPSIVMWVPFNEGWGQYDTARITDWVKSYDPTRLVNNASGWTDSGAGDVNDIHKYPGPGKPANEEKRAVVLGEFGGLGLPVEQHTWQNKENWGYVSYQNSQELTDAYLTLIDNLQLLIGQGLAAAVYTQTTDVEGEVNGLMTYDRAMVKMDLKKIQAANKACFTKTYKMEMELSPTSQQAPVEWRYTTAQPAEGWQNPGFDDSAWQSGPGGFGVEGTAGAVVKTTWDSPDICLRRSFDLSNMPTGKIYLVIHHDEDAQVYLNGQLITQREKYLTSYITIPVDKEARKALKIGSNILAVHCHQTGGKQYIDAGLVSTISQPIAKEKGFSLKSYFR